MPKYPQECQTISGRLTKAHRSRVFDLEHDGRAGPVAPYNGRSHPGPLGVHRRGLNEHIGQGNRPARQALFHPKPAAALSFSLKAGEARRLLHAKILRREIVERLLRH